MFSLLLLASVILTLIDAQQVDNYLRDFITKQREINTFPNGLRMGIKEITPLTSKRDIKYIISLPLTEAGESYYPGQAVLDAIWSSGSWSL